MNSDLRSAEGPCPSACGSEHNRARTLVTVAGEERAHGQVWFAPTNPALTVRLRA